MNEVFRQEEKYLINALEYSSLSHRVAAVLPPDPHNGAGGYRVRSLYFDTLDDADFHAKLDGLEIRRKIRLRIYDPADDFAMLEMKQKQGAQQRKRSIRVSRADAQALISGNYEALLQSSQPFAAECHAVMRSCGYRPKTLIEYQRMAYIGAENRTRITFDRDIRASESSFDLFSDQAGLYPVSDPFCAVLEVKYDRFLLSYIKDLLKQCNRSAISVSKYCMGRSVSMKYIF